MRSPGVVYRRYRQIKKKILYDKLEEARSCKHINCYYGKVVTYTDDFNIEHTVKVCGYNAALTEGRVDVCTSPAICNAFVNKWNKEKIIEIVEKGLSDHDLKKRLYPELVMLEWVLDKDLNDALKNPGFFGNIIIWCIALLEGVLKLK